MPRADRFLRACWRDEVDATPVWLMRQAGRYMEEYMALRSKYGFMELVQTPELACEITLQPINAFELDAAIIFADILPVLDGMGLNIEFVKGDGPVVHNPINESVDIEALATPPATEILDFTLNAIQLTRHELDGVVPLIGFSGAPFTLASYAIEGGGSKTHQKTKALMYGDPKHWHMLLEKLSHVIADYMCQQVYAGAQALQLFDSWAGSLSPADYREYVLPHVEYIVNHVKDEVPQVPLIFFGTGTGGMLEMFAQTRVDVIGVDWRTDLDVAWGRIGFDRAVQGNLDPVTLFAPIPEIEKQAARVLDSVKGHPGHIFNLGHGIHKETDVAHVRALVDFVHSHSAGH
jgi:uroporphyrinogen decarboxylase